MLRPLLTPLLDAWLGRARHTQPAAIAAIQGLRPAVAIIGGSEGIGLAIATRLARDGGHILLIGRTPETLAHARDAVAAAGPGATIAVLPLDICARDAFQKIENYLAESDHYLDRLVLSAGLGLSGPFDAHPAADVDQLLAVNVAATTRLIHQALPKMLARGRGGILALASLGGLAPGPYQAAYYASKAYLVSLIEAIAHENRGRGVRLSVVIPGPVETRFHAKMQAESALYRRLLPAMSAQHVAASALRGHWLGHTVIRPGLVTPVLSVAMRVLPHPILIPVIGWLLKRR